MPHKTEPHKDSISLQSSHTSRRCPETPSCTCPTTLAKTTEHKSKCKSGARSLSKGIGSWTELTLFIYLWLIELLSFFSYLFLLFKLKMYIWKQEIKKNTVFWYTYLGRWKKEKHIYGVKLNYILNISSCTYIQMSIKKAFVINAVGLHNKMFRK